METKQADTAGNGYLGYGGVQAALALAGRNAFVSFRHGEAAYGRASLWLRNLNEITMPERAFTAVGALVAGLVMGGLFDPATIIFGALAMIAIYCAGAVFNNIKDIEADKINDASRPLANGSLSVGFAWSLMALLVFGGMALAIVASPILAVACLAEVVMGVVYSKVTKGMGVLSYATLVTTHMAIPFTAGQLISGVLGFQTLVIVGFFFITEVLAVSIKDYKDVEGDRKTGLRTLPIMMGAENASRVTFVGLCLPLMLSWIPFVLFHLSWVFITMYVVIGIARAVIGRKLMEDQSPREAGNILKSFRLITTLEMMAWCLSWI